MIWPSPVKVAPEVGGRTAQGAESVLDLVGDALSLIEQLGLRHRFGDQPDAVGGRPVDEVRRDQVVLGFGHSTQQLPSDRGMIAGGDTES